ncbi:unnamed protein product, partial [Mesorhabditis spiculigera]
MDYKNMQPDEPNQQGDEGCLEMFLRPFKTLQDYGALDSPQGNCADGWSETVKGVCNQVILNVKSNEARAKCIELGGTTLASIHSAEENKLLLEMVLRVVPEKVIGPPTVLLGAHRAVIDRKRFLWDNSGWMDDGYENWQTGEPNNRTGHEGCVEMLVRPYIPETYVVGKWNDYSCRHTYMAAVCQIRGVGITTGATIDPSATTRNPNGQDDFRDSHRKSPDGSDGSAGTQDPAAPTMDGQGGSGATTLYTGGPSKGAEGGSPVPTQPVIGPSKET